MTQHNGDRAPRQSLADAEVAEWIDWHCWPEIEANTGISHVQEAYRKECYENHWSAANQPPESYAGQLTLCETVEFV